MGNFFAELKRRHIYRVAAAYAVVAWVLLQLVNNIAPVLDLPPWVARAFLLLLGVGFFVAIFFAWILGLSSAKGAERPTTGGLDWVLIGALVVVIGIFAYQQIVPSQATRTVQQASTAPSAANATGISAAVLPFVNLSGDASQEFFSDGMTEEITSALAKIPNLQVVGRTSAFQFKGENKDLTAIGQALHATHLIEGSVRKAGDRVRITAQLIRADNGTHLWTENYDRQLIDIFATQEDIAQAIAAALQVPLGLKQGETLVSNRTGDLESYQQYLLARSLVRAREIDKAIAILEPLVARDANYAPAWALLAYAYYLQPNYNGSDRSASIDVVRLARQSAAQKGEMAARRAMQLDAKHVGGYWALASILFAGGKWLEAENLYRQALALDPSEPDALHTYRLLLGASGRLADSLTISEKLRLLEPFVPIYNILTATDMLPTGEAAASIAILSAIPASAAGGYYRNLYLAQAYAQAGRYNDAADTLLLISGNLVSRQSVEDAAKLLRQAPAKVKAPETLPRLDSELNFVYAHIGALDRVMEYPERMLEAGSVYFVAAFPLWLPNYAPLRKTERFKAFVRKAGLVDYWKAKGWPDLCKPIGADDFACE